MNQVFHDLAYAARTRDDLLSAINSFLDDSIVLAPGDWDRHLLLPLLQAEISEKKKQRITLLKEKGNITIKFLIYQFSIHYALYSEDYIQIDKI